MANTTTLNETLRSPVDGTEFVRLATPGANWKSPLSSVTRRKLTSVMTFHVSTLGSDSGDGSVGNPWATPQHAASYISANLDCAGWVVVVQLADGTYAGPSLFAYPNGGAWVWIGNKSDNTKVSFTEAIGSNSCVVVDQQSPFVEFDFISFTPTISGDAIFACFSDFGQVFINGCRWVGLSSSDLGIYIDQPNNDFFIGQSNQIVLPDNTFFSGGSGLGSRDGATIAGSFDAFLLADVPSNSIFLSGTVTLVGTPSWANGFAFFQADFNSFEPAFPNPAFVGSATGPRFSIQAASSITTNFRGLNFLPGNAPGTAVPAALYDGAGVPVTVSALPTAVHFEGARMFVTDSTQTLSAGLGSAVAGTGANKVPVYSDGTNWIIG